eukprot:5248797-Prymnesium_polylepis.1
MAGTAPRQARSPRIYRPEQLAGPYGAVSFATMGSTGVDEEHRMLASRVRLGRRARHPTSLPLFTSALALASLGSLSLACCR